MKKRLLSAALALAMVLTMLPLSVFADTAVTAEELSDSNSGTYTVKFYKSGATINSTDKVTAPSDGYYFYGSVKADDGSTSKKLLTIPSSNGGVIAGTNSQQGTWYSSLAKALEKTSSVVLLGNVSEELTLSKNVTIDVAGKQLGNIKIPAKIKDASNNDVANPCTSLTIKDSTKTGTATTEIGSGTISIGGSGDGEAKNGVTVTLNNVKTSGTISAYYTTSCTINVKNSETGTITLSGESGGAVNVGDSSSAVGKTGKISITTTSTNTGGQVTVGNADIGGVDLSGIGAKLTATNSTVGVVTLFGHDGTTGTTLTDSQKNSSNPPSVVLNGGSATSIGGKTGSTEALTKSYSVSLNGNANGGAITLDNATITVNGAKAGKITLKSGSLSVTGSASAPASTGDLALGDDGKTVNFTVTGSNVTIGAIDASKGTVNVTAPADATNTFGKVTGTIANKAISGGTWEEGAPVGSLASTLRYQVKRSNNGGCVYYGANDFQALVNEYQTYKDAEITIVQDTASTKDKKITFKNGTDTLTVIKYGTSSLSIPLPTTVNGGAVSKWVEYSVKNDGSEDVVVAEPTTSYSTPSDKSDRILNAQVSDNTITKLTGASGNQNSPAGLTARLDGNVIVLSGAIPSNNMELAVDLTTDGKPPVTATVTVSYDNGTVKFANQSLSNGMRISNDYTTLIIGNGTANYTLNGSGLKVQATKLPAAQVEGYTGNSPVITTVSVSGTGWTTVSKEALATALTTAYTNTGSFDTTKAPYASFADSPAVKEALNAVVARITDSQIDTWIRNAQNAAWTKAGNTGTPNETQRADTGYDKVYVVAYLAVNISNYNTSNTPGTLTATLTPSYRVEVRQSGNSDAKYKLDEVKNKSQLYPQSGTLGTLTGEIGKIEWVPGFANDFVTTNAVAHQGGTYAYDYDTTKNGFIITHSINGSVGTLLIDGNAGLVELKHTDSNNQEVKSYYDTLQAAVDDAEEGDKITVDANYKGSCAITVTGTARTFTIITNGANRVTSNATGTIITESASGTEFTVQLERDNITTASITVKTGTNGSAKASAASAKPGDTVTITTTANSGYKAAAPTVVASTGNVTVTGSGNTWTFTVPANATSVTVTPNFVADDGRIFSDVDPKAWYADAVHNCYNTKPRGVSLMQGNTNGTFTPLNQLTRAEMVQILYNLAGQPSVSGTCPFPDVVGTGYHWAAPAITWAASKGYVIGYTDGKFHPEVNVSRQDMVLILYRYSGANSSLATGNLNNYYDGTGVGWWANEAMRWATAMGILSGTDSVALNGYLRAPQKAARCEAAVTLWNYYQRYGA